MTGSLYEELCTFMVISRSDILRMRNVWDIRTENQNAHFTFSIFIYLLIYLFLFYFIILFFSQNPTLYEVMWKNIVELGKPSMTIWCMRISR